MDAVKTNQLVKYGENQKSVKLLTGKSLGIAVKNGWQIIDLGTARLTYSGNFVPTYTPNQRNVLVGDSDVIIDTILVKVLTKNAEIPWVSNRESHTVQGRLIKRYFFSPSKNSGGLIKRWRVVIPSVQHPGFHFCYDLYAPRGTLITTADKRFIVFKCKYSEHKQCCSEIHVPVATWNNRDELAFQPTMFTIMHGTHTTTHCCQNSIFNWKDLMRSIDPALHRHDAAKYKSVALLLCKKKVNPNFEADMRSPKNKI